jgi:hypothetical protein
MSSDILYLNQNQYRAVKSITHYIEVINSNPKNDTYDIIESNKLNNNITSVIDDYDSDSLPFGILPNEIPLTYNLLLLGPGGSGKTTVIINTFNTNLYNIAFCAFTNKATQVLKNISKKFGMKFVADFLTIHKLLALEIKYLEKETEISFNFSKEKVDHLKNYDIIIFDECSTISKELFSYIRQAWEYIYFKYGHIIKFIFLGDYWQLPPVGEDTSIVFENAVNEKWKVIKLVQVMRSGNDMIQSINTRLLLWVDAFKRQLKKPLEYFIQKYPHNLVMPKDHPSIYISNLDEFLNIYLQTWKRDPDTVILTYSKSNCNKTNFAIQDLIDLKAERESPEERSSLKFYIGDRCCIDKPIEICIIKRKTSHNVEYATLDEHTNDSLYNGEIFDIIYAEDIKIRTTLNKLPYIQPYFDGQILTISRINDKSVKYEILHIPEPLINKARKTIRSKSKKMVYMTLISSYIKQYPKLDYGYCITIYKSQGSEWNNVLINLNSIKWCIIGPGHIANIKKKRTLFRTTYTALSRASLNMWLFWV